MTAASKRFAQLSSIDQFVFRISRRAFAPIFSGFRTAANAFRLTEPPRIVIAMLLLVSLGCGSSTSDLAVETEARSLSDNLKKIEKLSREIQFCVSEQAGEKTIVDLATEFITTLESTSSSIALSDLSNSEQTGLEANVEELKSAAETLQEDTDANAKEFIKTASRLTKKTSKFIESE